MNTDEIWNSAGETRSEFLQGAGRMGEAIQAFDWAGTGLGPLQHWPRSLRAVVQMALLSRQPICLFWGKDLNIVYNDAYAPFLGRREAGALGQKFEVVWADVWTDLVPLIRQALSGQGTWLEDMELTMLRNGFEEQTFWSFSYSPIYDDDGRIAGMINIATETTDAVLGREELIKSVDDAQRQLEHQAELDAQQRIIQREMAHRIKNILSMTMAIVSQTLRHSESISEANDTIGMRISALAAAQDILTESASTNADILTLVEQVLRPHRDGKVNLDIRGPSLQLPSQHALGMALAVHELATNALKYGALSVDTGAVNLTWFNSPDEGFIVEWTESGGPPVVAPTRQGFGSRLMSRIVPSYFSGTGEIHYEPAGLRYVLRGKIEEAAKEVNEQNSASHHSV